MQITLSLLYNIQIQIVNLLISCEGVIAFSHNTYHAEGRKGGGDLHNRKSQSAAMDFYLFHVSSAHTSC